MVFSKPVQSFVQREKMVSSILSKTVICGLRTSRILLVGSVGGVCCGGGGGYGVATYKYLSTVKVPDSYDRNEQLIKEKERSDNANEGGAAGEELEVEINSDEELQPQWRAMENRVKMRKSVPKGEGPSGRGVRRPSAWDHENV